MTLYFIVNVGSGYQGKFSITIIKICWFLVPWLHILFHVPERADPILCKEDSGRQQADGGDGGGGV